jgi:CRISPR/Cas system-associated exonuclease Cas4 (RecB family)
VHRLSYSALALYARCPYRFYAERIAGLSPADEAAEATGGGLTAAELGDGVHALLELAPGIPAAASAVRERYPGATDEDIRRAQELVDAWCSSGLAARVSGLEGVRRELPFAFEQDGVLLHGRFDLFHPGDGRSLVVDYKTNRLDGASPAEVVDAEYRLQRLVYALAALRAGAVEVEVVYVFLERPDEVVDVVFTSEDTDRLGEELSAAVGQINVGSFRPTPGEHACPGCPVLDRVCAGPRLPIARVPESVGSPVPG